MLGYAGRIARVNLTRRSVKEENLDTKLAASYIGGKGFGTWFLYNELESDADPLGPENKLIFAVGPATGSIVPTAGRYEVFFKSPLTGIYGESSCGGHFAPQLKSAGYDLLIIEGRASKPTYLWIHDRIVEFKDAKHLWGVETYETEDTIKDELRDRRIEVACIGPAGEALVEFATISNDYWRQAGRCGGGTVMGSKRLKAIAARGSDMPEVASPDMLRQFVQEFLQTIKNNPALGTTYPKYGTTALVNTTNLQGVFPTRYWSKGVFEKYEDINSEALVNKIFVARKACFGCPIGCGKLTEVKAGPYLGTRVEGPEFETIYAFGGLCEIPRIETIAKINDMCDRFGMDTITAGNVVAFAIESYRKGKLTSEVRLDYGDPDSVLYILEKIARREGLGETLARGVRKASEALGLSEIAVHVKGLEPPGYDPRGLKGMALGYCVSARGACHLRSTAYIFELRGSVDRFGTENKASLVKEYEDRFAIFDSMILCRFLRDVCDWSVLSKILALTAGIQLNENELRVAAERIVTLSRMFNVKSGISRKDDCLPKRLMEEALPEGPSKGHAVSKADVDGMLDEYYGLRGWNSEGIPSRQKEAQLGIS